MPALRRGQVQSVDVVDVDALIVVTDDTGLTELDPWNGRLLIRPRTSWNARSGSDRRAPPEGWHRQPLQHSDNRAS